MKVVEALFSYLVCFLAAGRWKERLVALGKKNDLLLTGEMLLPYLVRQGKKESSLSFCEFRLLLTPCSYSPRAPSGVKTTERCSCTRGRGRP